MVQKLFEMLFVATLVIPPSAVALGILWLFVSAQGARVVTADRSVATMV